MCNHCKGPAHQPTRWDCNSHLARGSLTGRRKMLSWLRPPWCPARGGPAQAGASCPAALPSPRGPRGGHSQRRCCLSAPPTGGRERAGKRCHRLFIFIVSTTVIQILSRTGNICSPQKQSRFYVFILKRLRILEIERERFFSTCIHLAIV